MKQVARADGPVLTYVIASDSAAFRDGIRAELEPHSFALVGEAESVAAAVEITVSTEPEVVLVDLRLPGNGLSAVARITRAVPTACVVVLGDSALGQDVLAALERGASGYLLNGITGAELATALRSASNGEPALPRSLVPLLVHQVRRGSRRRLVLPTGTVSLTVREWDVGELLSDGLGTEEIADRLGLSPVTIRRHVGLLVKKLGAPNRTAAIEALRMFAR